MAWLHVRDPAPGRAAITIPVVLGEILTAVVTPFRADGTVDLTAFRSLCAYLLDNGSDGLVVAGTTGEAPTLDDDERFALYEAALEVAEGHGTVVAGPGPTRPPTRST